MAPEAPVSEEERARLLRPYLRLAEYLSPEFVTLSIELLFLVRQYGINKATPDLDDPASFQKFFRHVHDGWKEAQSKIAHHLTRFLKNLDDFSQLEKNHRAARNKEGAKSARLEMQRINLQITVLRRILDVIAWTIFRGEQSTLRRLFIQGGQHNFSVKNIADAMPVADELNKQPHIMAVCTDMLSYIHLGDLIVKDASNNSVQFIELKSGQKNITLSKYAEFAAASECEAFDAYVRTDLNEMDSAHYDRAKRQAKRAKAITSTIQTNQGIDPNTGDSVRINTIDEPPQQWTDQIFACYEQLSDTKKWAIGDIDGCVYWGVYSDQQLAFSFSLWMMTMECQSPIYNLMDSHRMPSSRPLGATELPTELINKIFRGEVLIIICVDILKMIELANSIKPGFLSLASKRDSAEARKKYSPLEYEGRAVQTNSSEGKGWLGIGTIERIVFDQQAPGQLLAQYIKHDLANSLATAT